MAFNKFTHQFDHQHHQSNIEHSQHLQKSPCVPALYMPHPLPQKNTYLPSVTIDLICQLMSSYK